MDYTDFLKKMDEGFISVSGKVLKEAMEGDGEQIAGELESDNKWYYVPAKEYSGFRHIVVENSDNDWEIYYLAPAGGASGSVRDVSGVDDDLMASHNDMPESREIKGLKKYLNEAVGEKNADITGYKVVRQSKGDFKKILLECVDIVRAG